MILMNLFSIFDPSTSMNFSMNWLSMLFIYLFFPKLFWFIPSRWNYLMMMIINYLLSEFKLLLVFKKNLMNIIIFLSLFFYIMLNNLMGLFPYIFTATSHLIFSMTLSLTLWMSFMLFGWIINTNIMFIHLVPQGTPVILMPFMVIIETISNIIRPLTLSVRLAANIIAGHLLMTLISSFGMNFSLIMLILIILIQSLLVILELSVCFIQGYVFSVLSLLYSTETN